MRKTENKNLSEFIRAINADADRACERIKNEALREKREKLNDAAKRFESDCADKIRRAEKSLQSENNKAITELENKLRSELIQKRDSIRSGVFARVETKLKNFAKTDEYKTFLLKSAAEIGKTISGNDLVIFIKNDDEQFSEEIIKAVGRNCKIKTDSSIILGGLKASTDIQAADDTLERRLKNELEWFVDNSGLKIV